MSHWWQWEFLRHNETDSTGNTSTEFYDASEVWFGTTEMFQVGSEHPGHSKPGYSQECTCVVSGNIYFIWNIQALQKGWFVILIDWGTQLTPSYCHLQLGSCFCRYQWRAQNPSISKRLETCTGCYSSYQRKCLRGCPAGSLRLTKEKSQEHLLSVPSFTQTSYRDSLNLYTISSNAIDAIHIQENFSSKTGTHPPYSLSIHTHTHSSPSWLFLLSWLMPLSPPNTPHVYYPTFPCLSQLSSHHPHNY